ALFASWPASLALFMAFEAALAAFMAELAAFIAVFMALLAAFMAALAAFIALLAAFIALLAAAFGAGASEQAMPKAAKAKTVERAIVFFILILFSCFSKF